MNLTHVNRYRRARIIRFATGRALTPRQVAWVERTLARLDDTPAGTVRVSVRPWLPDGTLGPEMMHDD